MTREDVIKTINGFHALKADWNGYGAEKISPALIRRIEDLAHILPFAESLDVFVAPTASGAIQIEYESFDECTKIKGHLVIECHDDPHIVHVYMKIGEFPSLKASFMYDHEKVLKIVREFCIYKDAEMELFNAVQWE